MTLRNTGAALYGYKPGNTSTSRGEADYVIPGNDLNSAEISERGADLVDTASFKVNNYGGEYTAAENVPDHGDRIEFWIENPTLSTLATPDSYGETSYGETTASDGYAHEWSGKIAGDVTNSFNGGESYELEFKGGDFVYSVLNDRRHYRSYRQRDPGAIMREAIDAEAPELGTGQIDDVGTLIDLPWNGGTLLELLKECLSRSTAVAAAAGQALVFRRGEDVAIQFETGKGAGDYASAEWTSNDDDMVTELRVVGGTSPALDDERAKSSTGTVSENTRITSQISTRKAEIAEVEVWTAESADEGITVRLQADDGGAPVAIGDSQSDIAKKTLSQEFLANDGWTTFEIPSHTLPGTNPWLIVQSEGDSVTIGTDGNGNAAYRSHFPFPVTMHLLRPSATTDYRRRDGHKKDESLRTHSAAESFANGFLDDRDRPERSATFEAESPQFHALQVGELFDVDDPKLGAVGRYLVTKRDTKYNQGLLDTSITGSRVYGL